MVGGLYVIGGTDFVASLVPEEDAWCFREEQSDCSNQLESLDTIAGIDYDDLDSEITAHSARNGEKLDPGGGLQGTGQRTARAGRVRR